MRRNRLVLLSLLSGILLTPAWYSWGSGLLLFIAFLPLLFVEDEVSRLSKPGRKVFFYSFIGFLFWNILATWWIKNASFPGMLVAVCLNGFFMATVFWLFSLVKKRLGERFGFTSLVFFWIAYEYLYLHAEISWTWLNLGNGFANDIRFIQWYEFTGTLGGTLWVLCVNVLLFKLIKEYRENRRNNGIFFVPENLDSYTIHANAEEDTIDYPATSVNGPRIFYWKRRAILLVCILLLPSIYSFIRYNTYTEKTDAFEIVVIQPNIDPYEKFNDIPPLQQMDILIRLADSLVTPQTDYIVAPETFINNNLWLDEMEENPSIMALREFHAYHPHTMVVVGATAYKIYMNPEEATPTARQMDGLFYDSFNTALQIDSTALIPFYHKSQLVVGVEKMPYPDKLGFLRTLMLNLGGTFRSHGTQDYRDAFVSTDGTCRVAPVICYESIFGQYVTEYISKAGANIIFVITNDGWWGDTPGYVQHNSFSSLRAIETRRSIARSANTGISSFINQKGDILQKIPWWEQNAIRGTLNANDKLTFYVRHGDYLGRVATFFGVIFLLFLMAGMFIRKGFAERH